MPLYTYWLFVFLQAIKVTCILWTVPSVDTIITTLWGVYHTAKSSYFNVCRCKNNEVQICWHAHRLTRGLSQPCPRLQYHLSLLDIHNAQIMYNSWHQFDILGVFQHPFDGEPLFNKTKTCTSPSQASPRPLVSFCLRLAYTMHLISLLFPCYTSHKNLPHSLAMFCWLR